ncbi:hypothetical protein [Streptomyces sp. NPDC058542]|uniref:hypothetical protein n=1 Tax=Streptomyces sp. NPDC058542 TaxID=3346543 RepID=UPI00365D7FFF
MTNLGALTPPPDESGGQNAASGNNASPDGASSANTSPTPSSTNNTAATPSPPASANGPTAPASPSQGLIGKVLEVASGQDPARGRKNAVITIAILIVIGILAAGVIFYVEYYLEDTKSQEVAERDDRNADKIDDAKKPFDWKLNEYPEEDEPGNAWVIDRKLTPAEQKELKSLGATTTADRSAVWKFVKRLGGWRFGRAAAAYKLQLTSEKTKPVTITQMSARAVNCKSDAIKTFLTLGDGGIENWDDVHFNLTTDGAPATTRAWKEKFDENGEHLGMEDIPYQKVVSLGGTQSPGFLSMTPMLDQAPDTLCEWTLSLKYNINSGKDQTVTITEDEAGIPLRATGKPGEKSDNWQGINGTWTPNTF